MEVSVNLTRPDPIDDIGTTTVKVESFNYNGNSTHIPAGAVLASESPMCIILA